MYIHVDVNSSQQTGILLLRVNNNPPEIQAALAELRTLLRLNTDATESKLVNALVPSSDTEIAVLTRSIAGLILNIAAQVEVPPAYATQHRVFPGFEAHHDVPGIIPLMRIHSSNTKPLDAFVEIYYRIDNSDLNSKRVFAQLMQLFTMADAGSKDVNVPVVTIPAR